MEQWPVKYNRLADAPRSALRRGAGAEQRLAEIARRPVWTVSEASAILRCDETTVRREIKRGNISGVRVGAAWRIPSSQFKALLDDIIQEQDYGIPAAGGAYADRMERDIRDLYEAAAPVSRHECHECHECHDGHGGHDKYGVREERAGYACGGPTPAPAQPAGVARDVPHQARFAGRVRDALSEISMEHTVQLYLFGHPRIYVNNVRIEELERKNRRSQLIQLLAIYRNGIPCTQLAGLLSAESHKYVDECLNPNYVRNLVWGARVRVREKTGWPDLIQSPTRSGGSHFYRLPENTQCDLWDFEALLDEVDRLIVAASCAGAGAGVGVGVGVGAGAGAALRSLPVSRGPDARPECNSADASLAGTPDDASEDGASAYSLVERATVLREKALKLYKGAFCEGSTNERVAQYARELEERYVRCGMQQANYWRTVALRGQAAAEAKFAGQHEPVSLLPALHAADPAAYAEYARSVSGSLRPVPLTSLHGRDVRGKLYQAGPFMRPEVETSWREGIRNYERVLAVDIYNEEAYAHLMECYAYLRDPVRVEESFARCCDVLSTDLAQSPGPLVLDAYRQCSSRSGL